MARPAFTREHVRGALQQPRWLHTVDFSDRVEALADEAITVPVPEQTGGPWTAIKELERAPDGAPGSIAALTMASHEPGTLTLVVVNTVKAAIEVHAKLRRALDPSVDLCLVHSRFRPKERQGWATHFLHRHAQIPAGGRVIVATQVVEAGVDLSARTLITELAPWSSLVQRFGRCARYADEHGRAIVAGSPPGKEADALPYTLDELTAAAEGLGNLAERGGGASLRALEQLEASLDPAVIERLYPFEPRHVLRRPDLDDLFDTTPDLSGADLDISRFIREGDTRDVQVFWRTVESPRTAIALTEQPLPRREELCPMPVGDARKWLSKTQGWVLSFVDGQWQKVRPNRLVPGATVLVPASAGGYDAALGLDPSSKTPVEPVAVSAVSEGEALERTAATADDDDLSSTSWKTVAVHGGETGAEARTISAGVNLPADLARVLEVAARWHDVGKVHPVFQNAIDPTARDQASETGVAIASSRELAKAPRDAWRRYDRAGFRHELASALAVFGVLLRTDPEHAALGAPTRGLLELAGAEAGDPGGADLAQHPLAKEIGSMTASEVDLLLWLVVTHHGKVRTAWVPSPRDVGDRIRGVATGDPLPAFTLPDASGTDHPVPSVVLDLAPARLGLDFRFGRSWTERVAGLLERHGPFQLAWLEALLRAADVRASRLGTSEESR